MQCTKHFQERGGAKTASHQTEPPPWKWIERCSIGSRISTQTSVSSPSRKLQAKDCCCNRWKRQVVNSASRSPNAIAPSLLRHSEPYFAVDVPLPPLSWPVEKRRQHVSYTVSCGPEGCFLSKPCLTSRCFISHQRPRTSVLF